MAKPFLKWAGGKTALLPAILDRVPNFTGDYFEPFLGGGSVFFALAERRAFCAHLSDTNDDLIALYRAVALQADDLWDAVELLLAEHRQDPAGTYAKTRAAVAESAVDRGARFLYLNKACFNGLYRVNKAGKFNVPIGSRGKLPGLEVGTLADLLACGTTLCTATLRTRSFASLTAQYDGLPGIVAPDRSLNGAFIYCDPPYAPRSPTSSFTTYSPGGFNNASQILLRDEAKEWRKRGAHVLLSNSSTEFTRSLYSGRDWEVEEVSAPRKVSAKAAGRASVPELLVTGRPL